MNRNRKAGTSINRFPLSQTEYGIFTEQLSAVNTAYNIPFKIALSAEVDVERLCSAIRAAMNAHPYLKTGFSLDKNGEAYKFLRDCEAEIPVIDADDFDIASLIRPFDLQKDLLFRSAVIRSAAGVTLFLDIHHIIFDGTSISLLLAHIDRAYRGETLTPEVFTANDYAIEEKERLSSEEYRAAKEYYRSTFDGVDVDSSLFTDRNGRAPVAKEVVYPLSGIRAEALKAFAAEKHIKQSTVFNGAFAYLLSQYSGSEQVLYATVYHGRDKRL